ncbi:MAG: protein kinase [Gemmataceae bacterium]
MIHKKGTKYDEQDEPIDGFRLVDFLGKGTFGEVWKAVELASGKLVAMKIINLSHSPSALKEVRALNLIKNLSHPHLIPISTARLKDLNGREVPFDKADEFKGKRKGLGELIIVMGLGEKSLADRLKELNKNENDPDSSVGIPIEELLGYMIGAAKGIDFLNADDHHVPGNDGPIIHCDIKPDNLMIVSGEVQIVDCGVAISVTADIRQTRAAFSPVYSPPELTGNSPVRGTDQYSLAITYYELRTGRWPFDESLSGLAIMNVHAQGRLNFSSPLLSDDERQVLKWATSIRPFERYPSCMEMVKQLGRTVEGLPPFAPGKSPRSGITAFPSARYSELQAKPKPQFEITKPDPVEQKPNVEISNPNVEFDLPSQDSTQRIKAPEGLDAPEKDDALDILADPDIPTGRSIKRVKSDDLDPVIAQIIKDSKLIPTPESRPIPAEPTTSKSIDYLQTPSHRNDDIPEVEEKLVALKKSSEKQSDEQNSTHDHSPAETHIAPPVHRGELTNTIMPGRESSLPAIKTDPKNDWLTQKRAKKEKQSVPSAKTPIIALVAVLSVIVIAIIAISMKSIKIGSDGGNTVSETVPFNADSANQEFSQLLESRADDWETKAQDYLSNLEKNPDADTWIKKNRNKIDEQRTMRIDEKLLTEIDNDRRSKKWDDAIAKVEKLSSGKISRKVELKKAILNDRDQEKLNSQKAALKTAIERIQNSKLPEKEFESAISKGLADFRGVQEHFIALTQAIFEAANKLPDRKKNVLAILSSSVWFEKLLPEQQNQLALWAAEDFQTKQMNTLSELLLPLEKSPPPANLDLKSVKDTFDKNLAANKVLYRDHWPQNDDRVELLSRVVHSWVDARTSSNLEALRKLQKLILDKDLFRMPLAIEFLRLAGDKDISIEDQRPVYKIAVSLDEKKSTIHTVFQNNLERFVIKQLTQNDNDRKPNWDAIQKTCASDLANGWSAAAKAESLLDSDLQAEVPKWDSQPVSSQLTAYRQYLAAISTGKGNQSPARADALIKAVEQLPAEFQTSYRKKIAAKSLSESAISLHKSPDNPATQFAANPYTKDSAKLALAWLKKANQWSGKPTPLSAVHYVLASDELGDKIDRDILSQAIVTEFPSAVPPADLTVGLAFFRIKAANCEGDESVKAYAAATRYAMRVMDTVLESTKTERESQKAEKDYFKSIKENFIKPGISNSQSNTPALATLKLALLKDEIDPYINFTELNPSKEFYETKQKELKSWLQSASDNQDIRDKADAHAYHAYLLLLGYFYENLKPTSEDKINKQWDQIHQEAQTAYDLDKSCLNACRVLAIVEATDWGLYNSFSFAPESSKKTKSYDLNDIHNLDRLFENACKNLRGKKPSSLWRIRANLLFEAANSFGKKGRYNDDIKTLFLDSLKYANLANELQSNKPGKLTAYIEEDIAWYCRDNASARFRNAINIMKEFIASCDDSQKKDASVDLLRAYYRGFKFGAIPVNNENTAAALAIHDKANASPELYDDIRVYLYRAEIYRLKGDWNLAEPEFVSAISKIMPKNEQGWIAKSCTLYGESLLDKIAREKSNDNTASFATIDNITKRISDLIQNQNSVFFNRIYEFVPHYLSARALMLKGDRANAVSRYSDAYKIIMNYIENDGFIVEESFVLLCLAHEINDVGTDLKSDELKKRKELLNQLNKKFSWTLTKEQMVFVEKQLK